MTWAGPDGALARKAGASALSASPSDGRSAYTLGSPGTMDGRRGHVLVQPMAVNSETKNRQLLTA